MTCNGLLVVNVVTLKAPGVLDVGDLRSEKLASSLLMDCQYWIPLDIDVFNERIGGMEDELISVITVECCNIDCNGRVGG